MSTFNSLWISFANFHVFLAGCAQLCELPWIVVCMFNFCHVCRLIEWLMLLTFDGFSTGFSVFHLFFLFYNSFFFSNSLNMNKFFKRIISYFTQEQESGFFLVQKIKFCSLKKFFFWVAMVESWISPWLVLFSYYSFLTFDHMNIISFHSLPPPLYLDHWNWASSFSWLYSVAIKSFSVIFFFLLAFVNNQRYEIDFLTPGDAPRLPDLVCALWNWLIPLASPWPLLFRYHFTPFSLW